MCIAIIDRMCQGQAVSVHKARLHRRRERYVECDAREIPEEKRENLPVTFLVALLCR